MQPKIAVIDYGMGNLRSVAKALEYAGAKAFVTDKPEDLYDSSAMVFPGVGAFNDAIKNVRKSGFDKAILDAIASGRHFLGLCLGFQLLFDTSFENGKHKGLGVLKGDVKKFEFKGRNSGLKVPHMGWNTIAIESAEAKKRMFKGIKDDSYFYFVHSYYCRPVNSKFTAGETEYGINFCSAAIKGNVWGCQFHPEKSGDAGLKLLGNFVEEVIKCS